ncbi:MAG: hypothetical protein EOO89_00020 [Pedobacter sp.]|nr:MAG: hypothetical protein EOO89_00020 [Pedobacter sp.]
MITSITTIEDVQTLIKQLLSEGLNFHPDTPFEDYINRETGQPTYTKLEANTKETMLNQCFEMCNKLHYDIYDIATEIFTTRGHLTSF